MKPTVATTASSGASISLIDIDPESVNSRSAALRACGMSTPLADSLARDAESVQFLRDHQLKLEADRRHAVLEPTPTGVRIVATDAPPSNTPESVQAPFVRPHTDYLVGYETARRGDPLPENATEYFRMGFGDFR